MTGRPDIAAAIRERLSNPVRLVASPNPALVGSEVLRQLEEPEGHRRAITPSALSHCSRQLAYSLAGEEAEARGVSALRAMAAIGDAAEMLIVAALSDVLANPGDALAGWSMEGARTEGRQVRSTGTIDIDGITVDLSGSTDGIISGPETRAVLEVKGVTENADRMAGMALAAGQDPWRTVRDGKVKLHRHYWQNEAYMLGTKCDVSVVVTVCRDNGRIQSWWRERDPGYVEALRAHLSRVYGSFDPDEVERADPDGSPIGPVVDLHKRTGKPNKGHGALPSGCAMCSFARRCWGSELSETWDGPKRVLRIGQVPAEAEAA